MFAKRDGGTETLSEFPDSERAALHRRHVRGGYLERYISIVLGCRWLTILLACVVMVALATGGGRLTVSDSLRASLGEGNPQLSAFEAFEATYSESNMALIAIAPRDGSVFTRETLGAIEWQQSAPGGLAWPS